MALTLDQLQALRDQLLTTQGRGVVETVVDGMTVRYSPSGKDIRERLAHIDAEIAKLTAGAPKSYSYAQYSKDGRGNNPNG